MTEQDWKAKFEEELQQAEIARNFGNEGRARVCARRAAGIVIGEYLLRNNLPDQGPSAYDRMNYTLTLPEVPESVKEIVNHFLVRVDTDFNLPIDADLIADARWLEENLLLEQESKMYKNYNLIKDLVKTISEVPPDSIVSRTIHDDEHTKVIVFGFAKGQELSEHTASMPAIIQVIRGKVDLTLGSEKNTALPNTWAYMSANLPHSLYAKTASIVLLTMIKNPE